MKAPLGSGWDECADMGTRGEAELNVSLSKRRDTRGENTIAEDAERYWV